MGSAGTSWDWGMAGEQVRAAVVVANVGPRGRSRALRLSPPLPGLGLIPQMLAPQAPESRDIW